jgi:hypothetical protein
VVIERLRENEIVLRHPTASCSTWFVTRVSAHGLAADGQKTGEVLPDPIDGVPREVEAAGAWHHNARSFSMG